MKKLWLLISGLSMLVGCSNGDDLIWDFYNHSVYFAVKDATGRDLLDPATEGNILNEGLRIVYNGEEYPLLSDLYTRATLPRELGFRLAEWKGCHYLTFGEFDPGGYRGEAFVVEWGDGTRNEVVFDLYTTWKRGEPTIHRRLWLDGAEQPVDSPVDLYLNLVREAADPVFPDYRNEAIVFTVEDADGADLLDPYREDNVCNTGIEIKYGGESYRADWWGPSYLPPRKLALRMDTDSETGRGILSFGDFSPLRNYRGETFSIDWKNGRTDEVSFDLYVEPGDAGVPTVRRALKLNGEEYELEAGAGMRIGIVL